MYLNEIMAEKQEQQQCMCQHFFRTSINWQIPALSSNECSIIIDFYALITYTFCITLIIRLQENSHPENSKIVPPNACVENYQNKNSIYQLSLTGQFTGENSPCTNNTKFSTKKVTELVVVSDCVFFYFSIIQQSIS